MTNIETLFRHSHLERKSSKLIFLLLGSTISFSENVKLFKQCVEIILNKTADPFNKTHGERA